jgi:hypothetical protein
VASDTICHPSADSEQFPSFSKRVDCLLHAESHKAR